MRFTLLNNSLQCTLSLPIVLRGVTCLWSIERCDLISEIFVPFRKIDLTAALYLGIRNPTVLTFSMNLPILSHHISSAFQEADCQTSACLNTHLSLNLHPSSDQSFWTYGRMPIITQQIRTIYFKVISTRLLTFPS